MHYCKYQVQKSTALGLILPQNLRLEVRRLDEEDRDAGLLYETTNLKWWECMATLPPKFLLLSAGGGGGSGSGSGSSSSSSAATAPEPPAAEINGAIAKVMRPLGNLPPRTRATIEMATISEHFKGTDGLPSDMYHEWQIHQQGWKRHYTLQPVGSQPNDEASPVFTWRGSHSVLASLTGPEHDQKREKVVVTSSPVCHGNLKFQGGPDNQLLAAWQQRRDTKILGTLYVFDAARECIPLEVVVTSCLYVVMLERILWTTFFGS